MGTVELGLDLGSE